MNHWLLALIILLIASIMTMSGRGGGNFYIVAIVLAGFNINIAATTGQFILVLSSLFATIFFGKNKMISWKMVIFIGIMTTASAFLGGFFSETFNEKLLKLIFSLFVTLAALLMLKPFKNGRKITSKCVVHISCNNQTFEIDLLLVAPVVLVTGFISGMVGISGGSFLVPLMVLFIRIPIHLAVGTSTTLVMLTASAGFLGHLSSGHFNMELAIPLAIGGIIGSIIGSKITFQLKAGSLKLIFATTSIIAAIIMIFSIYF